MGVRIAPIVELREARAEIGHLRNRVLILAQALHDLQQRLVVKAPPAAAPDAIGDPDAAEILTD